MKRFGSFCTLLIGAALAASAVPAYPEEQQAAPAPESGYSVKEGDTLWDLSGEYLKDPFKWEEIHKINPEIKNPHWIYPGQKLVIPGLPEEAADKAAEGEGEGEGEKAPAAEARPGAPMVEMGKTIIKRDADESKIIKLDEGAAEKIPVTTTVEAASAGFISEDVDRTYRISGDTLDGRDIYSAGDELLIEDKGGLVKDQLLLIGRPVDKVKDPSTGRKLGVLIEVSGILKLTGEQDGKMAGTIEKSFREARKTDLLYPYREQSPVYEPVPVNEAFKGKFGYVAASKLKKDTSSFNDIVYLNLGSESGIRTGDRFVIRRSGGIDVLAAGDIYISPDDYEMPDKEVGEVIVISVMPKTSAARAVESSEMIKPGYRAVYKY